ncbi:MAG: TrlF family AAA-like ATPase [Intestinibacter bartlettii]|uniref:TrlF family AAA-like ATPase n=1 Tax=Intestinibacter bartlettii TaxID=261299 RepID=UPI0039994E45
MQNYNTQGSIWRKWDLHIHSNASDGKGTPEQIIDKAKEKGIDVIALTDHHTTKNIDEIKKIGKEKDIVVISGIEFRTEYGAKSVHMIGLFPDVSPNGIELNSKNLYELVLNKLGLSEAVIIAKGKEENSELENIKAFKEGIFKLEVDFKKAADIIHELGGIVTVHAGNKTNGLDKEVKHIGPGKTNVKTLEESLGTLKEDLLKNYVDICEVNKENDSVEFYLNKYFRPSIVASDAHNVADVGSKFVWIKAEPNFEGLKQIIYEPKDRVKIQDSMPESKNPYQIISLIKIKHKDFGEQTLPINPNLNCIIGGRSSGKSILLGCIAKSVNDNKEVKKNNPEYDKYIDELINNVDLEWLDNQDNENRKVEYFPQSYINGMASNSKEINKLIEEILKNNEEKRCALDEYNSNLYDINLEIITSIKEVYKCKEQIKSIQEDLLDIGNKSGIQEQITILQEEIEQIQNNIDSQITEEDIKKYKDYQIELKELDVNKERSIENIGKLEQLKDFKIINDIDIELINELDDLKENILKEYYNLKEIFISNWEEKLKQFLQGEKDNIDEKNKKIEEILKESIYIKCNDYYGKNEAYKEIENKLKKEKEKMDKILKLEELQTKKEEKIENLKSDIIELQKEYEKQSIILVEKMILEKDDVKIIPKVEFNKNKFIEIIESRFNKRTGAVNELLEYIYTDFEEFIDKLMEIFNDLLDEKYTLKSSYEYKDVILDIISGMYLNIKYDIEYQGDTLSSMSEGKKAFVILRILLDFNENKCPILIDQPEDDLDNRAIYTELVSYIKQKKKERQIILVTHNPNIVVSADAEEVIVANQNGVNSKNQDNIKFEYLTGALENSFIDNNRDEILSRQGIREHVCEILEGGLDAFKHREAKYNLKQ